MDPALLPFADSSALARSGDSNALRAAAREAGCLFLPGLLPVDKVQSLGARLRAACQRHGLVEGDPPRGWSDPRMVAVQIEVLAAPELSALARTPALLSVLATLLDGAPERRGGDVCRVALPGAPHLATPPHQDAFYMKPAGAVWICWIPLAPCPVERGPLAVIAGSHAAGLRPHTGDSLDTLRAEVAAGERWTSGPMFPGDALLLDALVVHRALPNLSGETRLSVDLRFQPAPPLRRTIET